MADERIKLDVKPREEAGSAVSRRLRAAGMIPGVYDFTQTFINGSWDGNYTFMEPMMTREWLLTKPMIREDIKQPLAYQHTAYYPTVYSVRFDDAADEYDIALEQMMMRKQS